MQTDVSPSFGTLLRHFRVEAGLTQEALAERAGLTHEAVSLLERSERRRPYAHTVRQLAEALALNEQDRAALARASRRAQAAHPTPVPGVSPFMAPPTPLLGREQELNEIATLLRRDARVDGRVRLVTLTGPGGVGKTRLALQVVQVVGDHFADGPFVVSLVSIRDPILVQTTIAHALGVSATGDRSLDEGLVNYLRDRQAILLLDNFEHLLPAAPVVTQLLNACPALTVLVTSRSALRLRGEQLIVVSPLAIPVVTHDAKSIPDQDTLARCASVALFLQRVQAVRSDFALTPANATAISQICVALDGLPLAIELAAVRIGVLSPRALAARLGRRLPLLIGGARDLPERHQTLRATIDWSYDLLAPEEQALFRQLSVFAGGCTLDAVSAVCGVAENTVLVQLEGLASFSLLRVQEQVDGEPRFTMLETIREYAWERLNERAEHEAVQRRHVAYCVELVERAEPELRGPDQRAWLERLETEHDNLRTALRWTLNSHEAILALRLTAALGLFWFRHGHLVEGQRWLDDVLALSSPPGSLDQVSPRNIEDRAWATQRARVLTALGVLTYNQNQPHRALAAFTESLAMFRELENKRGTAQALLHLGQLWYTPRTDSDADQRANQSLEEARTLFQELGDTAGTADALANLAFNGAMWSPNPDNNRAAALFEQALSLYRCLDDIWSIAETLWLLGKVVLAQQDYPRATQLFHECLALNQEIGSKRGKAIALSLLAMTAFAKSDYRRARALHEQSLPLRREAGDRFGLVTSLTELGVVAAVQCDHDRSLAVFEEALTLWQEMDDIHNAGETLVWLAMVSGWRGDTARAVVLATDTLHLAQQTDSKIFIAIALATQSTTLLLQGDVVPALVAAEKSLDMARHAVVRDQLIEVWALSVLGDAASVDGDQARAADAYADALGLLGPGGAAFMTAMCLECLARIAMILGQHRRAVRLYAAAAAQREMSGAPLQPIYRDAYAREIATLRATICQETPSGADAFAAIWAEGYAQPQAATIAEACALARSS